MSRFRFQSCDHSVVCSGGFVYLENHESGLPAPWTHLHVSLFFAAIQKSIKKLFLFLLMYQKLSCCFLCDLYKKCCCWFINHEIRHRSCRDLQTKPCEFIKRFWFQHLKHLYFPPNVEWLHFHILHVSAVAPLALSAGWWLHVLITPLWISLQLFMALSHNPQSNLLTGVKVPVKCCTCQSCGGQLTRPGCWFSLCYGYLTRAWRWIHAKATGDSRL